MLKPEEKFVADCMLEYLGKEVQASYAQGSDPPDLLFCIDGKEIGIEVSRLVQPIFNDQRFKVRRNHDEAAIRIIEKLNSELGHKVDPSLCLILGISMPVRNLSRFQKELRAWVTQTADKAKLGDEYKICIQGAYVTVAVHPNRRTGKKIVGHIANSKTSADIGFSAQTALLDRLKDKHEKCQHVASPIWLALLNEYWLADFDTYQRAALEIKFRHRFERVFVVTEESQVAELNFQAIR